MLDERKPYKGSISDWEERRISPRRGLGYLIVELFVDHPQFAGKFGFTSDVIAREGNEIETRNSRYTLI